MERIGVLINKLQELHRQQASPDQLLHVAQMLQTELFLVKQQQQNNGERKKISVMMPANIAVAPTETVQEIVNVKPPVIETTPVKEIPPVEKAEPKYIETVEKAETPEPVLIAKKQFNVLEEVPTLAHQSKVRELNEVMVSEGLSLNERLSLQQGEVGDKLKDVPVKDIKKAISLNDRFIYIRELFRGDEIMYERSLKTINQFSIYPEAEFWIQRELKLKLAWADEHPLVKQFDQLVKRRFL